jgi:hypothetical protein
VRGQGILECFNAVRFACRLLTFYLLDVTALVCFADVLGLADAPFHVAFGPFGTIQVEVTVKVCLPSCRDECRRVWRHSFSIILSYLYH